MGNEKPSTSFIDKAINSIEKISDVIESFKEKKEIEEVILSSGDLQLDQRKQELRTLNKRKEKITHSINGTSWEVRGLWNKMASLGKLFGAEIARENNFPHTISNQTMLIEVDAEIRRIQRLIVQREDFLAGRII